MVSPLAGSPPTLRWRPIAAVCAASPCCCCCCCYIVSRPLLQVRLGDVRAVLPHELQLHLASLEHRHEDFLLQVREVGGLVRRARARDRRARVGVLREKEVDLRRESAQ
jgi:hypothetical protein